MCNSKIVTDSEVGYLPPDSGPLKRKNMESIHSASVHYFLWLALQVRSLHHVSDTSLWLDEQHLLFLSLNTCDLNRVLGFQERDFSLLFLKDQRKIST